MRRRIFRAGLDRCNRVRAERARFRAFTVRVKRTADSPPDHVVGDGDIVAVGEHRECIRDPMHVALPQSTQAQYRAFDDLA
jgi:hypothetical protein